MAKLTFIYGAMGSGKSISLIKDTYNYKKNGYKVLVIKPQVDTKCASKVSTRIGLEIETDILLSKKDYILKRLTKKQLQQYSVIMVDEAQFLETKQVDELWKITQDFDIPVNCYGLKTDFTSHFFVGSKRLLELADTFEELKIQCSCKNEAHFNARKINGKFVKKGNVVEIDGERDNVEYVPLCSECYRKNVLNK